MTDYKAIVKGVFPNGESWSTSRNITSNQSAAALLTTWSNAWTAAWTDATHGFQQFYPTATIVKEFEVVTLGANMQAVSGPAPLGVNLPGTATGKSLPTQVSVVAPWYSSVARGKTTHGHQALPACSEDAVTDNKITSTAGPLFKAAINQVRTAVMADGSSFFLFPKYKTAGGIAPYTKQPVDSCTIRDKVGTQDRRYKKQIATYF